MEIRAVAKSSRIYIGRLLLVETAALSVLIGTIVQTPAERFALFIVAAALIVVGGGQRRHRPLVDWIATCAAWCARPRSTRTGGTVDGAVLSDRDGLVAVIELGATDQIVVGGDLRLPDIDAWTPLIRGGPVVSVQIVVGGSATDTRALLAIRVTAGNAGWASDALPAALSIALRRIARRLDIEGIAHRRLEDDDLAAVTGAGETVQESWDHVRVNGTMQVALTAPLGAAGMTAEALGRLASLATAVSWAGTEAVVRVDASDRAGLASTLVSLAPARRLDGDQIRGRHATLPLALDPRPPIGAHPLAVPQPGVRIGVDRDGNPLTIRIRRRDLPIRVIVVGGPAAAEAITRSAGAVGVRLRPDVLDRPTTTDAAALRAADVVICQPMPAAAATVVATALGLSARTGAWLSRIDRGMVAVIADGQVRWALLTATAAGVSAVPRT